MPRPLRVRLTGMLYYITQQGAHDRPLFRDEEDYQVYLDLLAQYKEKHGFKLFAYAFLPEELHLMIEPYEETTISEIMRDLTSRYSKYYNGRYEGGGPLFKGRFRTTVLEKQTSLLPVMRFIHQLSPGGLPIACSRNSRDLFMPEASESTRRFRNQIREELEEIEAHVRRTGAEGSWECLFKGLCSDEIKSLTARLKKPVMGSPAFVNKIQAELNETAVRKEKVNVIEPAETAPAIQPSAARSLTPWPLALVFTGIAVVVPVGFFLLSSKILSPGEKAASSFTEVLEENAAENSAPQPREIKKVMIVLEGTEWDVRLVPMNRDDKDQIEHDRISFINDQVRSKQLAAKGFSATHYTMSVTPEGVIIWETMQNGPAGETVFWRGEWQEGQMRGVLNRQFATGESKAFHFIGNSQSGQQ